MAIRADRVGVREDQVDIHGRVTSPSFLNELLESLPEWTDMPVRVNGTEELLPSNNSVPVTSPILADIAYPDIRRDNQYFTYRESPTPVDGLAKIKSIKGNTLVWNQLVQNGNFADASGWSTDTNYGSIAVANNVLTYTVVQIYNGTWYNRVYCSLAEAIDANHKLLIKMRVDVTKNFPLTVLINAPNGQPVNILINITPSQKEYSIIANTAVAGANTFATIFNLSSGYSVGDTIRLGNIQVFDLTKMGIADKTDDEIRQWFSSNFPLPYYSYNQGTLLSFMGNGIKTTNKNFVTNFLADSTTSNISFTQADGVIHATGLSNGTIRTPTFTDVIPMKKGTYVLSGSTGGSANSYALQVQSDITGSWAGVVYCYDEPVTFTLEQDCNIRIRGRFSNVQTTNYDVTFYPMITYQGADQTFEPYTSSTLSLPISTYFPTGMKSAGTVYDELTPTKAITRIGAVDLGSLNWARNPNVNGGFNCRISDMKLGVSGQKSSVICPLYETINTKYYGAMSTMQNMQIAQSNATQGELYLINTSYSDVTAFKTAMSGVYLYYELATPVELPTMSFE